MPFLTQALFLLLAGAAAFAIYMSNAQTLASYDSAPNSLLAFNVIDYHRLDFDRFRDGYFGPLGGAYAFTEAPNGHLTSIFPVGAALVALPLYAAFSIARASGAPQPAIDSPAFEPLRQRYEKTAAAALAALSVVLFLLCARELGTPAQAAIAATVYALGTSMWSIGSQALWQHGPVNLCVLAMVYALLRAGRAPTQAGRSRWLVAAGVCAGFLPVIRPTALLLGAAGFGFAAWCFRRDARWFAVGFGAGIVPGIAWNAYFFHSLAGGYADNARAYIAAPGRALTALAALLVSPSRGVLIFSPILVFALAGLAAAATRMRERPARLIVMLATACLALVVQYAFFRDWWSGFSYGPRFLTDTAAIAALALIYVLPAQPLTYVRSGARAAGLAALFGGALVCSIGVQFVGVNSGAAGSEWNAVPISIDREPGRVWQLRDSQIERNARAAYYRFFAWNIAGSPAYGRALRARVTAISPSFAHIARGSSIEATALFRNDGRFSLHGYDSGVYLGQLRVAVRIFDARLRAYSQQNLYVNGSPPPGEHANAVGTITMPRTAGTYLLECDPILVGGGTPGEPSTRFRIVVRVS